MVQIGRIGFIGAGQMAEALARGFSDKKLVKIEDVVATDPAEARMKVFGELGARTVDSNSKVFCASDWRSERLSLRRQAQKVQLDLTPPVRYV